MAWWQKMTRGLMAILLTAVVSVGVIGCSDRPTLSDLAAGSSKSSPTSAPKTASQAKNRVMRIAEVSPPEVIQVLQRDLERYQPEVKIISPRPNQVIEDDAVSVQFRVKGFPLFKNADLGLGLHLNAVLDNQPPQSVYSLDEPLLFSDLSPGTHTIRVFAARPWEESFKNQGAYDQVTFSVFAKTEANNPKPDRPLLTYNLPNGSYGAEPVLLDFYLTNAPLHLVAREDPDDDILDWKIRCTINGDSFFITTWQPVYLKGLQPGKNWIRLEFLDENDNVVPNAFNSTLRLIDYQPQGDDVLAQIVRGERSVAEVRGIIDPDYIYVPPVEDVPIEEDNESAIPEKSVVEDAEQTVVDQSSPEADQPGEEPSAEDAAVEDAQTDETDDADEVSKAILVEEETAVFEETAASQSSESIEPESEEPVEFSGELEEFAIPDLQDPELEDLKLETLADEESTEAELSDSPEDLSSDSLDAEANTQEAVAGELEPVADPVEAESIEMDAPLEEALPDDLVSVETETTPAVISADDA